MVTTCFDNLILPIWSILLTSFLSLIGIVVMLATLVKSITSGKPYLIKYILTMFLLSNISALIWILSNSFTYQLECQNNLQ